jgi:uncharacterized protein YgiM (DUF1202 family)
MTALALAAIAIGATVIERRDILVEQIKVTDNKGIMFPVIGVLKKGDKLDVLEKQSDGWLKVQLSGKEGYVWANNLEPPKNGGLLAGIDVSKITGTQSDPNASSVTASAATKGIGPGVQFYADKSNYKLNDLVQMIDNRDSVTGNVWFDFLREGNVGPFK